MDFLPYSKEQQLKGHQKEKDKPAYKPQRHSKKKKTKKKPELYKGRVIPHRKKRSSISEKEYDKALQHYKNQCPETGSNLVEMHHIVFRSQSGRGTWRNLVPLYPTFHKRCHTDREYADMWRKRHEQKFGPHYSKDKWDLWKEGLITSPTDELYEEFMLAEEKRCAK